MSYGCNKQCVSLILILCISIMQKTLFALAEISIVNNNFNESKCDLICQF